MTSIYSSGVMAEEARFLGQSVPERGYNRMLLILVLLLFSVIINENFQKKFLKQLV